MSKKGDKNRQHANHLIKELNGWHYWTIPGQSKPEKNRKERKAQVLSQYKPKSFQKQPQKPKNGFIKYRIFELIFRQMGEDGKLITWPCHWTMGPKGRYVHTDKNIELVSIKRYSYPDNKKFTKVRVIKKALFKTELAQKWKLGEDLRIGGIFNGSHVHCRECDGYGQIQSYEHVWNPVTNQYDLIYGIDCPNCTGNEISSSVVR